MINSWGEREQYKTNILKQAKVKREKKGWEECKNVLTEWRGGGTDTDGEIMFGFCSITQACCAFLSESMQPGQKNEVLALHISANHEHAEFVHIIHIISILYCCMCCTWAEEEEGMVCKQGCGKASEWIFLFLFFCQTTVSTVNCWCWNDFSSWIEISSSSSLEFERTAHGHLKHIL